MDMADCLGLPHETVSRELRGLRDKGVIATRGRRSFLVPQLAALEQFAHGKEC
ncbi:MAG: helix-turn-helix domain-containing protein [Methyloceanibacter sp.]